MRFSNRYTGQLTTLSKAYCRNSGSNSASVSCAHVIEVSGQDLLKNDDYDLDTTNSCEHAFRPPALLPYTIRPCWVGFSQGTPRCECSNSEERHPVRRSARVSTRNRCEEPGGLEGKSEASPTILGMKLTLSSKLDLLEPFKPSITFEERVQLHLDQLSDRATQLFSWQKISNIYPQQPEMGIHMIVERPSTEFLL